jgi:hypothetical protein
MLRNVEKKERKKNQYGIKKFSLFLIACVAFAFSFREMLTEVFLFFYRTKEKMSSAEERNEKKNMKSIKVSFLALFN